MYKLQLIRKYLIKRRIAWVALLAVMLCTAMVLVVVSVMGGWLAAFIDIYHGMSSDLVVRGNSLAGFPYYQEMIDGIQKMPDAVAAVPVIRTGGMIDVGNENVQMVQVVGFPQNIGQVNDWPTSLHLNVDDRKKELQDALNSPANSEALKKHFEEDLRNLPFGLHPDVAYRTVRKGPDPRDRGGLIITSSLLLGQGADDDGTTADILRQEAYTKPVSLTLVPVNGNQQITPESIQPVPFWIVDDCKSRLWALDFNNVYISFDEAQRDLGMAEKPGEPARCSEVEVKAKPGTDLLALRKSIAELAEHISDEHQVPYYYSASVYTWEEQQGDFIDQVHKEVVLTTALFSVVSVVAVLLIFCMFYMIVMEKTRDIGILKSTGATGWGIMAMFLGYGLSIGVLGAGLGFLLAFVIVRKINEIHAWLGRQMHVVIFNPKMYQLNKIPNTMDTKTVEAVIAVAIASALLGAMIPAIRGATMNPVDALRYE